MQLQAHRKEIQDLKGEIVAISSDELPTAIVTKSSLGLKFTILPDPDKKIIRLYHVLHPEEGVARPAVFILDSKGFVRYRYIGKDAADRPRASLLVNVLRWL